MPVLQITRRGSTMIRNNKKESTTTKNVGQAPFATMSLPEIPEYSFSQGMQL
jgi:hypothetical protein